MRCDGVVPYRVVSCVVRLCYGVLYTIRYRCVYCVVFFRVVVYYVAVICVTRYCCPMIYGVMWCAV